MIAIIDYGVGNLRSVQKAFEFVGYEAIITEEKKVLERADKIVLPGVGAFASGINSIKKMGLDKVIIDEINKGKYFMGICLGMQMIFSKSYEYGENEGLNIIKGEIKLLPDNVKKPHIGWNNLNIKKDSVLFKNIGEKPICIFCSFLLFRNKRRCCYCNNRVWKGNSSGSWKGKRVCFAVSPRKEWRCWA